MAENNQLLNNYSSDRSPGLPPLSEKSGWPWQTVERSEGQCVSGQSLDLPRITIVTPSFNQSNYLEQTIRSVIFQGYPNLEYIVIDGGSTDGSVEILQKYSAWIDYWVSEPDRGQAHALNKGFARATGEWLAWLNSDDIYLPGALWRIAREIQQRPEISWLVGQVTVTDEELHPLWLFAPVCNADNWQDFLFTKCATGTSLPQPGSFWTRSAWDAAGLLDETLCYVMDYEYWIRLARVGYRPVLIDAELALFRFTKTSKSGGGVARFIREEQLVVGRYLKEGHVENFIGGFLYKIFLREIRWYRISKNKTRSVVFGTLSTLKRHLKRVVGS